MSKWTSLLFLLLASCATVVPNDPLKLSLATATPGGGFPVFGDAFAAAVKEAEALPPPPIESMFSDVYKDMPRHIEEQMRYAVAMGAGGKNEGAFPL